MSKKRILQFYQNTGKQRKGAPPHIYRYKPDLVEARPANGVDPARLEDREFGPIPIIVTTATGEEEQAFGYYGKETKRWILVPPTINL